MKIPQLIQEIIDYYLYFASWKARIRQVNIEYSKHIINTSIFGAQKPMDLAIINSLYYNSRILSPCIFTWENIYNYKTYPCTVAKLPPRYYYSNTKEQLKSLYF